MSISNRERVGRALEALREGLYPFVVREMKASYGNNWTTVARNCLPEKFFPAEKSLDTILEQDVSSLLIVMWECWNDVFKRILGKTERSLVSELRETRNCWAHNDPFSLDDAYRAFDSISRLLSSISFDTTKIDKQKQEILRLRFEEQTKRETRKILATEGEPMSGLKPWREITTPHPDIASGCYQEAEFAADLWQVYLDEASKEYGQPDEFFQRTYLTEGLKRLLGNALTRLGGMGGDPVIELQTNFGGGKTHAMLALYHLFSGANIQDLPGIESVLQNINIKEPPQDVNLAVFVGNKISPGATHTKRDGTKVRTMWGEIAWQLGGKEGYEMIREADETATNPGDTLKQLFNRYAPCLILVDEWVAYARQLHDKPDLVSGTLDTHFTFAQTLSESAKNAERTLLVVSIPSSDIEVGGDQGKEALNRLKNAIGRVESPWRPATAEESFEIVRRRLFQSTTDTSLFVARDTVTRSFAEMYRNQTQEFPSECREADYERRLKEAYPIHPELFDRLYSDWSSLDKFQRTRGVLRLMAKVIHSLWERQDKSLLIMPGHVPMDNSQVKEELTRYLDDNWVPVIEKDVDGPSSISLSLDRQNSNLGRYSASRRVTRTIYMGSAPIYRAANRGVEDKRIKLGCVQPGENPTTFGDALRRLSDKSTYLYVDGNRYWISLQPNVTRTAQEKAEHLLSEEELYKVNAEIIRRLKEDKEQGEFSYVYIDPESSADIPDSPNSGIRLVILSPKYPYNKSTEDNKALDRVREILNYRGNGPRYYKNTLVFAVPEESEVDNFRKNVAYYLAWQSILDEREVLNLDVGQIKQAETKLQEFDDSVVKIFSQAYIWVICPDQETPHSSIIYQDIRLQNPEGSLVLKISKKLSYEDKIMTGCSGILLRQEVLDKFFWSEMNHISVKSLWECLVQYLYLPRLKDSNILLEGIKKALASMVVEDNFAHAEGWDEEEEKYLGLVTCQNISPSLSDQSLIVKTEVAMKQLDSEKLAQIAHNKAQEEQVFYTYIDPATGQPQPQKKILRRFYGSVDIDPVRINRDAPAIANEIVLHLSQLKGAKVRVTMEIEANVPEGMPEEVIRTVTENCRTLKFDNHEFEPE